MLVITRKVGERIAIGSHGEIVVTVTGVSGRRIRLGIEAEPGIPVQRGLPPVEPVRAAHRSTQGQKHVVELAQ